MEPTWAAHAVNTLVEELGRASTTADVAAVGVGYLRDVTGARWAEVVQTDPVGRLATIASADAELTAELQHQQAATSQPPVPGTAGLTGLLVIDDLAEHSPWPAFAKKVTTATPVRSVVFTYLDAHHAPTVVPVYHDKPSHFTPQRRQYAQLISHLIGLHLTRLALTAAQTNLQPALASRQQIGIATGILAALYGLQPDTAFQLLRTTSSHRNRKLRDLADDVIRDGDLPTN